MATVNCPCNADSYGTSQAPSQTAEGLNPLAIGYYYDEGWATMRSVFKFDLSGITNIGAIQAANLYIYQYLDYVNNSVNLTVRRNLTSWLESTVNWSTLPNLTTEDEALMSSPAGANFWINANILGIVQDWLLNGQSNYGVTILAPEGGTQYLKRPCSREDATYKPYLAITYTQKPNAPSISSPSIGGSYDASINLTCSATHPDSLNMTYEWQYSPNGGTNWYDIGTSSAGASGASVTLAWNTSVLADGSNYKVRVRSKDPYNVYSAYTTLGGTFTISHYIDLVYIQGSSGKISLKVKELEANDKVRVNVNNVIGGCMLVPTNDPTASGVRVQTASGVMSLAKT